MLAVSQEEKFQEIEEHLRKLSKQKGLLRMWAIQKHSSKKVNYKMFFFCCHQLTESLCEGDSSVVTLQHSWFC